MAAAPQREVYPVKVQTAYTLPESDSDWTTQAYLRYNGGSEGDGSALGEAVFEQFYGSVKQPGGPAFRRVGVAPDIAGVGSAGTLQGKVVRVLKYDPTAGTVTIDGAAYTPFWWGIIHGEQALSDGGYGGVAGWAAVGLASALDQISLREGWCRNHSGGRVIDPGFLPPFNRLPTGDRSATTMTVGGKAVYVHDLVNGVTGVRWSAKEILDLLLAGAGRPRLYPDLNLSGWEWTVSDPRGCLNYSPETLDLNGETLLGAIGILCSRQRGITWRVSVSGAIATIHVDSGVPTPITSPLFTLPSAGATADLDVTDSVWIADFVLSPDYSSVYDVIEVRGAQPWVAITLYYDGTANGSLQSGWSAAALTAWNTNPWSSLAEKVYRRFEILGTWNGGQYDEAGIGLRDAINSTTSAAYGTGGYDGTRSYSGGSVASSDSIPPAFTLKTERMLPCSPGFSILQLGPRQPPVVVMGNGVTFEDVSQLFRVEIDDDPPSITIDDGEAGIDMSNRLAAAGTSLLVTVGVRESQHLRVSWQRPRTEWPRSLPRVKVIQAPHCEQWVMLKGTIQGVTDAGALRQAATTTTLRDDSLMLNALLTMARAVHENPAYTVGWTDRANLDIGSTYRPGTLLRTATDGRGTTTVNAVIRRRSWRLVQRDGVDMYDTTYDAERVMPDPAMAAVI